MDTSAVQPDRAMNLLSLDNKTHVLGTPGLITIGNRIGAAGSYLGVLSWNWPDKYFLHRKGDQENPDK